MGYKNNQSCCPCLGRIFSQRQPSYISGNSKKEHQDNMLTHPSPHRTASWVHGCKEYSFEDLQIRTIATGSEVTYHRLLLGQSYSTGNEDLN